MFFSRINRYVAAYDKHDNIGGFRKHGVKIIGSKSKVINSELLDEKFFEIREKYFSDPNYDEINLFLGLARIKFFGNGNKRSSQILMNALLVDKGYCPFIINFREEIFSKKLIEFYDNENFDIYSLMLDEQQNTLKPYLLDEELEKIANENNKNNKK